MRLRTAVWVAPWLLLAAYGEKLTLDEAEQTAQRNNPQIGAAAFNALAAEQVTREVKAALYPNVFGLLTAVGGQDASRIGAGALNAGTIYDRVGTGAGASQLLWDFGRTRSLVETSRLRASAQSLNTQAAKYVVRLLVDRAYFGVLRTEAVLRVAEQTLAARQLVSDQVDALFKSGLKSSLDATFAQVNVSEAKLLLAQAQNDVHSARAELATAMGVPERAWELSDATISEKPEAESAALIREALKSRPEVASVRLELEAAKRQIDAERALWMPTISAAATAGVIPAHTDRLAGSYSGAGVNVNIPVFNGHAFSARRSQAEYRASSVEQVLHDLENRVARDVTIAWLGTQTAYQRIGLTTELLDRATQALDLAQSRYELGLGSIVELSQAQLAKTNAELQTAAAKYDFQLTSAVLRFQSGTQ